VLVLLQKRELLFLIFLRDHPEKAGTTLFWETKSIVQPRVLTKEETWKNFKQVSDERVKDYVEKCGIISPEILEQNTSEISVRTTIKENSKKQKFT